MNPHPAIAFAALILLGGCAQQATATVPATDPPNSSSTPETSITTSTTQVPLHIEVATPATVTVQAVRVDPPTTLPPDPCGPEMHAYVNGLPYEWGNKTASSEAFRVVATCRQWSQATQDFYRPGIIDDILVGESAQCPWHRGRQRVGSACAPITPKGVTPGEDSGFFMITSAGWGANGYACKLAGYCSPESIVKDAWSSMDAGLVLIEAAGKFPWTWSSWACGYHPVVCRTWPKTWSNL